MNKIGRIVLFIIICMALVVLLKILKENIIIEGTGGFGHPAIMWIGVLLIPFIYRVIFKKKIVDNEKEQLYNLHKEGIITEDDFKEKTKLIAKKEEEMANAFLEKELEEEISHRIKHQIEQLKNLKEKGILSTTELEAKIETARDICKSKIMNEKNHLKSTSKKTKLKLNNNKIVYIQGANTGLKENIQIYNDELFPLSDGVYSTFTTTFKVEKGKIASIKNFHSL